ncbi:MAG: NAD(P)H-binding protein [Nocardioidaceae bacterium]|nr:NAD(P)H-binding protein [Nocardioidaceae bacterium]
MRIAVYGATGMIGSRVAAEALSRGHEVTGITRSGGAVEGAKVEQGDAADPALAARIADEHDVVVASIPPGELQRRIENLAANLGGKRFLMVGGAGSLLVGGERLVDSPDFPAAWKPGALETAEVLEYLRTLPDDVDWTYLSPAPMIGPGERTGRYQVADDTPAGDSVSAEDYAVALVDELERPAHRRTRFTVGS